MLKTLRSTMSPPLHTYYQTTLKYHTYYRTNDPTANPNINNNQGEDYHLSLPAKESEREGR
jgi:hypothetical protein